LVNNLSLPETNSIPKDSATVILVRRAQGKTSEVFLARRHASQSFMAGVYVFPGGQLEASDADIAETKRISASDDFQPHALLQDSTLTRDMALGFYICAIRETFEETGVLFARKASDDSIDFGNAIIQARFAAYRQPLNEGKITLAEIIRQEDLVVLPELLIPYAHWITPEIVPQRFSTRFFLAEMPHHGQNAVTDKDELTSSLWVTPGEALQMYTAGKISMMPPTLKTLEEMAEFCAIDELFAAARNRKIYPIMPQPMKSGLKLPHDPEYSIERYKQPARPGETSRFLATEGIWQSVAFTE
jgi:8-oxo-dGTP pyrophosphatase MutT (NUDIX family)